MNLKFVLKEAIKGLKVNYKMGITGSLITSFSLFVLFLFFILTLNAFYTLRKASEKIEIDVYLKEDVPDNVKNMFLRVLKSYAGVKNVQMISSGKAREEFEKEFPEYKVLLSLFEGNIFPERIILTMEPKFLPFSYPSIKRIIQSFNIVDEVIFGEEWILPLSRFIIFLSFIDIFLIILLIFLLGIVMVQTLRLTILRRKEVINLLEIIGATEATIRGPFVFEGVFYGLAGGLVSGFSLFLFNIMVKKFFNIHLHYTELIFSLSTLFGLILGFISSLIAVSGREKEEW